MRAIPDLVLEKQLGKKGNRPEMMVLVQWRNGMPQEATWEIWEELSKKFPEFILGVKGLLKKGVIVMI